jgi:hypothetical protein
MPSPLIRVHPRFAQIVRQDAREWSIRTGRPVSTSQITGALAQRYEKNGRLNVTIPQRPRRGPGGTTHAEKQFWAGFDFTRQWP